MNFAVLVTQLPATAGEHARLLSFGTSLQPLPKGVFQPAQNVWMATREDAAEFIHAAKIAAADLGVDLRTYTADVNQRVLVS